MRRGIAFILAVLFAGACSVKEDRTACPCRLVLDFRDVDTSLCRELNLLVTRREEVVLSEVVEAEDFMEEYVAYVPHGELRVNVWSGDGGRAERKQGIVIPYGCECPPLYMHSFIADTRGESCREKICLRKNHCRLTIMMEGMETIPYSLTFKGNVDGYGLDGRPSLGDFSCVAYPADSGDSRALLPRQLDASLQLDIDDGTSVVKTFAIGEHIASSGYDWTAEDLDDLTIVLDYYITHIKVTVQGWDKEYDYSVTL